MGSIRLILDSLDLNREEYDHELHQKRLLQARRSSEKAIQKFFRGSNFVRHLIPDNIKEVEFIYKVNFDAGRDTSMYIHNLNQ